MRKPWLKWYPADWRDIRLRRCSLEARGLLIELIGIMHEAEPYGHIVINGQVPSDAEIGRIIGVDPRIVRRLTTALIEAGVLSRTTEGVVYSRRMVRDHEKAFFWTKRMVGTVAILVCSRGLTPRLSQRLKPRSQR